MRGPERDRRRAAVVTTAQVATIAALVMAMLGCVPTADGDEAAGSVVGVPLDPAATEVVGAEVRGLLWTAVSMSTQKDAAPNWPTLLRFSDHESTPGDPRSPGARLADTDTCGDCHAAAQASWEQSAHRFASMDNPIYRGSVEAFAEARGATAARLCAGCHDAALMADEVFADALAGTLPADDPRLRAGVTCVMCHRATATRAEGNASLVVSLAPVPTPVAGDPASIERHRAAVKITGPRSTLCSSCHRGFVSKDAGHPHLLVGIDEVTFWQSSPYAGHGAARLDSPVERRDCVDCHMKEEAIFVDDPAARDGRLRAHRVSGGHTWLAAMRGDAEALAAAREQLRGAATIDIAAAGPAGGPRSYPGETLVGPLAAGIDLEFDVVVRNVGTGHRFPGGVTDMQDTWIEVIVLDEHGRALASAGDGHRLRDGEVTDDVHVLRSFVADAGGTVRDDHLIAALHTVVASRVLGPRATEVVRYAIPHEVLVSASDSRRLGPLTVRATLLHRSRNAVTQTLACAVTTRNPGKTLNGCVDRPITEIAVTEQVLLGNGGLREQRLPTDDRLFELGMGLAQGLGEHLDEARGALEAALAAVPVGDSASARRRARIWLELARVAGRQGRIDEALALAARAQEEFGAHAAIALVRGDALAQVWRWPEAAIAYAEAVRLAPGNLGLWVSLAKARGSSGDEPGAWSASLAGLSLSPRAAELLRSGALAAQRLGQNAAADAQMKAYADARGADDGHDVRLRCQAASARCATESNPVHVHRLIPLLRDRGATVPGAGRDRGVRPVPAH